MVKLGSIAQKQGNYTQGEKYLSEGLKIARQTGRPRIISVALYEYGNLFLSLNQVEKAEEKFRETLKMIPEGDQELTALAQYGLARVAAARGNKDQARQLGTASVSALDQMGHRKTLEIRFWLDT